MPQTLICAIVCLIILIKALATLPPRLGRSPKNRRFLGRRRSKAAGECFSCQRKTELSELCSDEKAKPLY